MTVSHVRQARLLHGSCRTCDIVMPTQRVREIIPKIVSQVRHGFASQNPYLGARHCGPPITGAVHSRLAQLNLGLTERGE